MKTIQLTQGQVALVDDEDFDFLSQWKWCANKRKNTWYALRADYSNGDRNKKYIYMHRSVLKLTDQKIFTDHIDHNGLNNQKNNLRIATKSQNAYNNPPRENVTSKYKGVCYLSNRRKWLAQISNNKNHKFIGEFKLEVDAAVAYNKAAIELHGEFANINIINQC